MRKKFHCTSEKQKRAIKRSYAERAKKAQTVTIQVKNYRDKNGGHPHVIVDDIEDKHVSVGFTHDRMKGKGHPNYSLEVNPLGGKDKSYMRRQGTVAPKKDYIEPRTGVMTENDYAKAKEYGERAKNKYIEKNDKKSNEVPNILQPSISPNSIVESSLLCIYYTPCRSKSQAV